MLDIGGGWIQRWMEHIRETRNRPTQICRMYFLQRCNSKMEEVKSFQQMVLEHLDIQSHKNGPWPTYHTHIKISSKQITDLNVICKTVRHLVTNSWKSLWSR